MGLKNKRNVLWWKGKIPLALLDEMKLFCSRNVLIFPLREPNSFEAYPCCQRCLKAFAIEKAKELELGEGVLALLDKMFDCETGHDGYYLDGEHVLKNSYSIHQEYEKSLLMQDF